MGEHSVAKIITDKLTARFAPKFLDVVDDSHLHAGHAGARPEGESHFRVVIVSKLFSGLGPVDRHRLVNEALAEEMSGPIHALAISARTPEEAG